MTKIKKERREITRMGKGKRGKKYYAWGKEGGGERHQHGERNYRKEYTAIFGKK